MSISPGKWRRLDSQKSLWDRRRITRKRTCFVVRDLKVQHGGEQLNELVVIQLAVVVGVELGT